MRNLRLFPVALVFVLVARVSHAQQPTLSPERQAAVMEAGRLLNDPVAFVLQHRQELALTGQQVVALEKLGLALRDSATVRMARRLRQAQQQAAQPGLVSATEWSGPVNEVAIRNAMSRQSAVQAEIMIAVARDRRAVGALLTSEQRTKLPQLQMAEMMKAARPGSK